MNNFYIGDLHFGWTNKYEGRTLEHDQLIKENWNRVVTNKDVVYILGDIGKTGKQQDTERLISIIATLKGHKVLIAGNHDSLKDIRLKQLFVEIVPYKEIIDNFNGINHNLVLSHYPILMWNRQHKGAIHLYGHLHTTDEYEVYKNSLESLNAYFKDKTLNGRTDCPEAIAINIGAMLPYMNYTPRTLKEIIEKNLKKTIDKYSKIW